MPTVMDAVKSRLRENRLARSLLKPLLQPFRSRLGGNSGNGANASLPQPFIYTIDSPRVGGEVQLPSFILSGWIAHEKGRSIDNLTFCTQNGLVQPLTTGSRPDVEGAYPQLSAIGFFASLDVAEIENTSGLVQFTIDDQKYSFPVNPTIATAKIEEFFDRKKRKMQRLQAIVRCPACGGETLEMATEMLHCGNCGATFELNHQRYNFLSQDLVNHGNIKPTHNVSSNPYDEFTLSLIQQFPDGLILDNGCGMREMYYDNVINFEIVDYPSTDVLGIGEKLPFKSNSFDAVLSFTVLEHVRNPFECAAEILRVLKPGGTLYAVVPFLQPFHGYPDHYYNMTSSGLKNLFEKDMEVVEVGIAPWGKPIMTLNWFLKSYMRGLPEPIAEKFKQMRVADFLDNPFAYLDQDFVAEVAPDVNEELACSNFLIARKVKN